MTPPVLRCSRCLLPATLPDIRFEAETGVCSYCTAHAARFGETAVASASDDGAARRVRLERMLKRHRARGPYDCLVGLSGGKDSTYVLYLAVRELGLKPLVVNFDNGFRSTEAVANIEATVARLGVGLLTYRPDPGLMRLMMRTCLERAGELCTPCLILLDAFLEQTAHQYGIPWVLSGSTERLSSAFAGASPARYYDRVYFHNVLKGALPPEVIAACATASPLRKACRRLAGRGPWVVNLFDYLPVDYQTVNRLLERELGWRLPGNTVQHGDCRLDPVKDHLLCRRWGCSEVTGIYSALIRDGQLSREAAWLQVEREEHTEAPEVLPEFLQTLGLTATDFERAVSRRLTDFPNHRQSAWYRTGRGVARGLMRWMGRA